MSNSQAKPLRVGIYQLQFSERVDFVPTASSLRGEVPIVVSIDGTACKMLEADLTDQEEPFFLMYQLRCTGIGSHPDKLRASLLRELKNVGGKTAVFLDSPDGPMALDLSFADAHAWNGADCIAWHMP